MNLDIYLQFKRESWHCVKRGAEYPHEPPPHIIPNGGWLHSHMAHLFASAKAVLPPAFGARTPDAPKAQRVLNSALEVSHPRPPRRVPLATPCRLATLRISHYYSGKQTLRDRLRKPHSMHRS